MEKKKIVKLIMSTLFTVSILAGCSSKTLKTIDKLEVEYGTPISTSIETYLSDDIGKEDKAKILETGKVEILEDKKVDGQEYQALGEYTVQISYGDDFKNFQHSICK